MYKLDPRIVKDSMNKNRALHIAKQFITKDSMKLYYAELCCGCKYNDGEEQLECCYCQDGNYYEEDKEN